MKKRIVSLMLAAAMVTSVLAGCGAQNSAEGSEASKQSEVKQSTESGTKEDMYTITMAYIGGGQPNEEAVEQALNDLVQKDLGMKLELVPLPWELDQNLNLMLSGGDKLDVLPIRNDLAAGYINAGQLVDLSGYIDEYGKGIIDYMGEDVAKAGQNIEGFMFGIPSNKEGSLLGGIVMRKDILDELQIDVSTIKTWDDMTPVFAKVKEAYPEMDCITGTNMVDGVRTWDNMTDNLGVLMNYGEETTVTNLFETEEYSKAAHRIKGWYDAGYVKLDAATTTESVQSLMKNDTLFSFVSSIKPGFVEQNEASIGHDLEVAYICDENGKDSDFLASSAYTYYTWGVAQQSEDKAKAMEFLNYAYTSPEWNNLINFGIEGEDYVRVEGSEVLIDYPEGKDASNCYHLDMGWALPNQFIGYVWNGMPEDIWQQLRDFNTFARKSAGLGFMYDSTSVSNELVALKSVLSEYRKAIETGSVSDVDGKLKEFNEKLYDAGLQKVIDIKQEQFDKWLANKK